MSSRRIFIKDISLAAAGSLLLPSTGYGISRLFAKHFILPRSTPEEQGIA
jgi:hypothetical protein